MMKLAYMKLGIGEIYFYVEKSSLHNSVITKQDTTIGVVILFNCNWNGEMDVIGVSKYCHDDPHDMKHNKLINISIAQAPDPIKKYIESNQWILDIKLSDWKRI